MVASVLSSRWRKRRVTDHIDAEEEKEDEEEAAARSESTGRQPLLASKNIYQLLYMVFILIFTKPPGQWRHTERRRSRPLTAWLLTGDEY